MENRSGIYSIENIVSGKVYIGQTVNLKDRKSLHFCYLKNNKHCNPHLQSAYNKYGKKSFVFKVFLYCEPFELTRYEQWFVDTSDSEMLYNIRLECVDSNLGIEFSEEAKENLSRIKSGKNAYWYGKHLSEDHKQKISNAHKGKKLTKKHRENMSKSSPRLSGEDNAMYGLFGKDNPNYGRRCSKETKEKISNANSGEKCWASKLTRDQVFEVLDLYHNKKESQSFIVKKYNMSSSAISNICHGKTWKHVYEEFMDKN